MFKGNCLGTKTIYSPHLGNLKPYQIRSLMCNKTFSKGFREFIGLQDQTSLNDPQSGCQTSLKLKYSITWIKVDSI